MKFCNSPFLLALALIVSSPLMSHASACSNSTIEGSYAFTIHGTLFLPNGSTLVVDGIDKVTFDGNGNFTQVDAVAMNGILDAPGWRPGTGTYSVNPDCTRNADHCGPGPARPALAVYRRPIGEHDPPNSDRSGIRNHGRGGAGACSQS